MTLFKNPYEFIFYQNDYLIFRVFLAHRADESEKHYHITDAAAVVYQQGLPDIPAFKKRHFLGNDPGSIDHIVQVCVLGASVVMIIQTM